MPRELQPGDPVDIRPLAAADAERLTACFQRVYGDSYVAGFFYDPAAIRARLQLPTPL